MDKLPLNLSEISSAKPPLQTSHLQNYAMCFAESAVVDKPLQVRREWEYLFEAANPRHDMDTDEFDELLCDSTTYADRKGRIGLVVASLDVVLDFPKRSEEMIAYTVYGLRKGLERNRVGERHIIPSFVSMIESYAETEGKKRPASFYEQLANIAFCGTTPAVLRGRKALAKLAKSTN